MKKTLDGYLTLEFSNTKVSKDMVKVSKQRYLHLLATSLGLSLEASFDIQSTARAVADKLTMLAGQYHGGNHKDYILDVMVKLSQLIELLELLDEKGDINES